MNVPYNRNVVYKIQEGATYFVGAEIKMFGGMTERRNEPARTFKADEVLIDAQAEKWGVYKVGSYEGGLWGFYQNRGFVVFTRNIPHPELNKEFKLYIIVPGKYITREYELPEGFSIRDDKFSSMTFRMSKKQKHAVIVVWNRTYHINHPVWMTAKQIGVAPNTLESLASKERILIDRKVDAKGVKYYRVCRRTFEYINKDWTI